jgi:hypothetical protein
MNLKGWKTNELTKDWLLVMWNIGMGGASEKMGNAGLGCIQETMNIRNKS